MSKLSDRIRPNSEVVKELVEALEFYADKDRYVSDDINLLSGNEIFDIVCFDLDRNLENGKDFAGAKARAALEKFNKAKGK